MNQSSKSEFILIDRPDSKEGWITLEDKLNNSGMFNYFGMSIDLSNPDQPIFAIPKVEYYHRNGTGTDAVNGGVIAALCDLTIGISGALLLPHGRKATVDLYVQYIKPIYGNSVKAVSYIKRRRSQLIAATADIMDENGVVCSKAKGRVFYMPE